MQPVQNSKKAADTECRELDPVGVVECILLILVSVVVFDPVLGSY